MKRYEILAAAGIALVAVAAAQAAETLTYSYDARGRLSACSTMAA